MDGNVFFPEVLTKMGEVPTPVLPAAPSTHAGRPPRGLFRLRTATPEVRANARSWLKKAGDKHDERLLHEAETSLLFRPPVHERSRAVDDELSQLFIEVARSWVLVAERRNDPRYLNAALKVIGCATLSGRPSGRAQNAREVIALALAGLERIRTSIPHGLPPAPEHLPDYLPARCGNEEERRIVVLAGEGSRGLPLFLDAGTRCGFKVHGILHQEPAPSRVPSESGYATAWYPTRAVSEPAVPTTQNSVARKLPEQRHLAHGAWDLAIAQLTEWNAGLLVLLGMDVVPANVLEVPKAGTINAHNGELPAFRGMDAVAWARLAGRHPVCTVHRVTPDVDAGHVLASATVSANSPDLRGAVKSCQIALLSQIATRYSTEGTLPVGRSQDDVAARRWYRMHPAIRRILDQHHTDDFPPTTNLDGSRLHDL